MATAAFKHAISQPNIAFLIGNGVNLAEPGSQGLSWKLLFLKLAYNRQISLPSKFDETMSITEIADILRHSANEKNKLKSDLIELSRPGINAGKKPIDVGQRFFLENFGFEVIEFSPLGNPFDSHRFEGLNNGNS